jgi:hypothetical protein
LIRVIDIETTGTDPANDAIIEIASVDLVRGGGIANAMDTLVRPGKPIPPSAAPRPFPDLNVARSHPIGRPSTWSSPPRTSKS